MTIRPAGIVRHSGQQTMKGGLTMRLVDKFGPKNPLTKQPVNDAAFDMLHAAMTKARNYVEEISNLPESIMADRIYSKETNAETLGKEVLERAHQAERVLRDATTKALAVLARVELEIAAPEAEPDSHEADLEVEVRAHLRTLNDQDRAAVFADALKRDDMVTIGAVQAFAEAVINMAQS